MKLFGKLLGLALVFGLICAVSNSNGIEAAQKEKEKEKEKKAATIKQVMGAAFNGKKAFCAQCSEAVKGEKWEDAAKAAKSFTDCVRNLAKNDPPKGDKESWTKLAAEAVANGEKLEKACADKKAEDATAALKAITSSCGGCHGPHKPAKK